MATLPAITDIQQKPTRPVKILQFGQGNFLRAFVDYFVEILNEETAFDGSIVIVKPTDRGNLDQFKVQDSLYTVMIQGLSQGEIIDEVKPITSVADTISPYTEYETYISYAKSDALRFIVSNTTEAGIVYTDTDQLSMMPPDSFPGKLTQFLYARFRHFEGDPSKGLIILPTELIDYNGDTLKETVHRLAQDWALPDSFIHWIDTACQFINTLVDRIVSGFPKEDADTYQEKLGYADALLVTAEPFGLWVIEAREDVQQELCLQDVNLPILFTEDYRPYKERKVRILNGAHTSSALLAYSCGKNYVKEMLEDDVLKAYIKKVLYDEIIPAMAMTREISEPFAEAVLERFANPFINHSLLAISLNSISKWKARCLPSLQDYHEKFGRIPKCLLFSLAALLNFYRGGEGYEVKDEPAVLQFFASHKGCSNDILVRDFLATEAFHGLPADIQKEAANILTDILDSMDKIGPYDTVKEFIHGELY